MVLFEARTRLPRDLMSTLARVTIVSHAEGTMYPSMDPANVLRDAAELMMNQAFGLPSTIFVVFK